MNWLESFIYGLVSGFSEFLPISSGAHQALMMKIFGESSADPVRDLFVHAALLIAVITSSRSLIIQLSRDNTRTGHIRRGRRPKKNSTYDLRLVKTAAFPMLAGLLLSLFLSKTEYSFPLIALFLVINGVILYVPEHMRHANKDARYMTGFDGLLIGLGGALSAFPGVSRIGTTSSFAIARGADKHHALNWALLLSIPALIILMGNDIIVLSVNGIATLSFSLVLGYTLSALVAFCGGYVGILLMRFLTFRIGFSGFAYYSWGAALFMFILYLTFA